MVVRGSPCSWYCICFSSSDKPDTLHEPHPRHFKTGSFITGAVRNVFASDIILNLDILQNEHTLSHKNFGSVNNHYWLWVTY